jgi:glycolate oxidase FAD binding subunit
MTLQPRTLSELSEVLAAAHSRSERLQPLDLRSLNNVLEYTPEDMTVTVEAGMTLSALQTQLAKHRQWLALDPPHPERLTVGELLAFDLSGPRRLGYGTVRDSLIGLSAVLADGRVVKSGGKVVKNVAGFDLGKLFVGSRSSLGVIAQASFKLRPLPEAEALLEASCLGFEAAERLIEGILASELRPVMLDLHNQPARNGPVVDGSPMSVGLPKPAAGCALVLGFAGAGEDVDWQISKARELGFERPGSLAHESAFWQNELPQPYRWPVLPSAVNKAIQSLGPVDFVARAGNGVIYFRGGSPPQKGELPQGLMHRVKEAFDPKHILPDLEF